MKLRIYSWYASCAKDGFSEHINQSWDALIGLYVKFNLKLHWWGDALKRVLMYSRSMEMYGVPGRSAVRKESARVRIPSLASKSSVEAFFCKFD